ncbi:MAG: putative FecR, partial [Bryobacterales bacterium]|nr:putative FecR [Bryobacterales bacterium]
MSIRKQNPEQILDQAISDIRTEEPSETAVEQAAARVWSKLAQSSGAVESSHVNVADGALRTCGDFQALIPAYVSKQLPDAQIWLLEDHIHGCPQCRTALEAARSAKVVPIAPRRVGQRFSAPQWKWAVAATLAIGVGMGAWVMRDNLLPAPGGPRAVVQNVTGVLYRVSDTGSSAITRGTEIGEREDIRTARGSGAMVALADGSLVEMRERSEVSFSRKRSGTTIRLERGSVIVRAAKQRQGRLYVATNDCLVSVKGTIFAVDRGTKGSRVSVIQGEVRVDEARQSMLLHPGQQVATDATMAAVSIKDDISWSQDLNQYLALLGEFAVMGKQLEQVPGPGLRYSSRLLDLAPDGTVLYVGIPNIGGMLGDAQQIFNDRLQQSAVLRDWWNSQPHPEQLKQVLDTIRGFSDYLGNEVVITVAEGSTSNYRLPMVMAEVTRSGFREYVQQQIAQVPGAPPLTVVDNAAALPSTVNGQGGYALLMNNIIVVSPDPLNLQAVATLLQQPGSGSFSKTAFYQRIADAYRAGASWLICADMEQILPQSVKQIVQHPGERRAAETQNAVFNNLGVYDMQHLLIERKEAGGKTENRATLTFAQARRGMASWLAPPAPMGALDFISPDASFVAAFVVKQPRAAAEELFGAIRTVDPNFDQAQAAFESRAGVSTLDDLAGPLGGEVAFGIDGPVLPMPSWKFAVEVYDPVRLQHTIEALITRAAQTPGDALGQLTTEQSSGRTFYALRSARSPFELHYTFVDGYLVAAANRALLTQAISQRATGYTLTRS